jgi:hypothetical protein
VPRTPIARLSVTEAVSALSQRKRPTTTATIVAVARARRYGTNEQLGKNARQREFRPMHSLRCRQQRRIAHCDEWRTRPARAWRERARTKVDYTAAAILLAQWVRRRMNRASVAGGVAGETLSRTVWTKRGARPQGLRQVTRLRHQRRRFRRRRVSHGQLQRRGPPTDCHLPAPLFIPT